MYFTFYTADGKITNKEKKAVCWRYKKQLSYSTTTNLWTHMLAAEAVEAPGMSGAKSTV